MALSMGILPSSFHSLLQVTVMTDQLYSYLLEHTREHEVLSELRTKTHRLNGSRCVLLRIIRSIRPPWSAPGPFGGLCYAPPALVEFPPMHPVALGCVRHGGIESERAAMLLVAGCRSRPSRGHS